MVVLSGGVGGAKLARGVQLVCDAATIVVNVGDDDLIYGVHVAADLDTVTYTLAGIEGEQGWGIRGDSFTVMDQLARLGVDTTFRLGDRDLATNLKRTTDVAGGLALSTATAEIAASLGVTASILPVTDDRLRTRLRTDSGEWLSFQDYFVRRRHRDTIVAVEFDGAADAKPAPGVVAAIASADLVIIGPSNPPLSIWPILAVAEVRDAVAAARVVAVSPLFGGTALKGPADRVMASLGLPPGNAGVAAAYDGLLTALVVDTADAADEVAGVAVHAADTRLDSLERSADFAAWLIDRFTS